MPARPAWSCTMCGDAWPCAARRARLLEEHAQALSYLKVMMALYLSDASGELAAVPAGDLHTRFLGWVPDVAPARAEVAASPMLVRPYVAPGRWPANGVSR
jgi:hypothetical protein